jgi:3-oxosteroid 1-dehydrogenase
VSWDAEYELVVVGSGGAAMGGAATGALQGLSTLVVEKTKYWGGTTAYSGGGVWIPANSLMLADGVHDSAGEALTYLEQIVGDVGPASSRERKLAFLEAGPTLIDLLIEQGVRWQRPKRYPDYYPELAGGKVGRQLEPAVFDANRLGPVAVTLRRPPAQPPLLTQIDDAELLVLALRTPQGFLRGARALARTIEWRVVRRANALSFGRSLLAQLMMVAQRHGAELWLASPFRELIVEDGAVTGVVVEREGQQRRVRARRGVLLAAGGFARNRELRTQHQPVTGEWSSTAGGDTGDAIEAGVAVGAATALLDDAWWGMMFLTGRNRPLTCLWERSLPGAIVVDIEGRRFVNESTSYVDVGHAQLERGAVPAFLIMDARHRQRYVLRNMLPRLTPKEAYGENGFLVKARSLDELAGRLGVGAQGLRETVQRFNRFAATGVDEDFHRGESLYDHYYGDPRQKPNPNLGPIERAPFWGAKVYPGDLGTKGGLVTDEHARVVRDDGTPIAGLYAAGNTSATVMGRTYPGPGGTLGPAIVFGYLATKHMAGR